MSLRMIEVTPGFTICGQISLGQIPEIAACGFRLVINNRPDGEEEEQPESRLFGEALAAHDISYVHIPVVVGNWTEGAITAFRDALDKAGEEKVLAFCRSGTRAAAMWVLAADEQRRAEAAAAVARAKIDLSKVRGLGAF